MGPTNSVRNVFFHRGRFPRLSEAQISILKLPFAKSHRQKSPSDSSILCQILLFHGNRIVVSFPLALVKLSKKDSEVLSETYPAVSTR
jgi:hypothetical protein